MSNVDLGRTSADYILRPEQGAIARVTAGGPAPGQVVKNYSGTITLSGSAQSVTLETVTTGRTYLITDVVATSTNTSAILFQVQAAGTSVFQAHINSTKGIEALGIETQPQATSGQAVTVNVPSGSGVVAYNVYGVES